MKTLYYCACFFFLVTQSFAQISKKEAELVKTIDAHTPESLELLKKIVNLNSGTMNLEGVRAVGNILVEEFKSLGMNAEMTSGNAFGRAGHLEASTNYNKGLKFLLIGHLDTVFEPESPFQKFTMVNDSIMNGPGVADMKGGDVIILLALKALKEAGLLDKMAIKVVMTGDEERSGSPLALSKKALTDAADWADVALGFENADGEFFEDNLDRTFFFCKGVVETVKKFGWAPDIVHAHGWMTSLLPALLKTTYCNEPIFQNAQVIYSAYDAAAANAAFAEHFEAKATNNGLGDVMSAFYHNDKLNVNVGASKFSEGTIIGSANLDQNGLAAPILEYQEDLSNSYLEFYESVLGATEENA